MVFRLSGLYAAALLLLTAEAYAGAWTQDEGKGQFILTGQYYQATHYYDNGGHTQSEPAFRQYILNPYMEYGVKEWLTLGANLSLQHEQQNSLNNNSSDNWGIGDSEFFVRGRLWQKDGLVIAAEPLIKLPRFATSAATPAIGSAHPDAGMGFSAGYGFSACGLNHFADIDTQYRYRFGPPTNQVRLAGTLGIGLSKRWMMIPQTFITYRTSSSSNAGFTQSPADDYNQVRLQLSTVYKATDAISVQMGAFRDVSGKNVGVGNGMLLSVWKSL